MFLQVLEYLVTNDLQKKGELGEKIAQYGGTPYGIINTISQLVDEESLEFVNRFFNNWNTLSGSKAEDILQYLDKFYRLGFIKFVDKVLVERALKDLQFMKTNEDIIKSFSKNLPEEEKDALFRTLNKFNNDELKLLVESKEFIDNLKPSTEVQKKENRGQEKAAIKEIYEKLKKIKEAVHTYKSSDSCSSCPLYERTFVGIDYNIVDPEKENFDIVFVGEAPGNDEAKQGIPFVGKSGQFLRKTLINKFKNCNFIITNACMCHPNKNATPSDKAIVSCNRLLKKILSIAQPKVVVSLGDTALKSLIGFDNYNLFKEKYGGVLKNSGKQIKIEGKPPLVVTFHPSYAIRNGSKENVYEPVEKTLKNIFERKKEENKPVFLKDSLLFYKLPEKLFDKEVSVLDVQTGKNNIYILYRKNGTTELLDIPKINYGYKGDTKNWIENSDKVKPLLNIGEANYETDFSYSNKVMVDWKLLRETNNISYDTPDFDWAILDIEVYTQGGEFPKPEEAKFPVVLASIYSSLDGKIHVFLIDGEKYFDSININNNLFPIEYHNFQDERILLEKLMQFLLKHDVITAWNLPFDLGYIYNRFSNFGYHKEKLDRIFSAIEDEEHYINIEKGIFKIPGKIVVDLLSAYRMFSPGEKESFSLGYISSLELGVSKTTAGSNFSKLWEIDRQKAVEYNCYDTALCYLLNKKLDILNFLNELRFVANSSWQEYQYKGTLIDGLLLYHAKKDKKVLHNKYKVQERSYMGGYVYQPISGRHEIVQFDFSSQYPSIILTTNAGYETFFGIFSTPNDYKLYYYYLYGSISGEKNIFYKFFNQEKREFEETSLSIESLDKIFKKNKITVAANGACFVNLNTSLIKQAVEELIKKRKHFKKLFSETGLSSYNVKQYTYKILANSIYGVIGDSKSRLYMPDIAESITVTGQIANKTVATSVEKYYDRFVQGNIVSHEEFKELFLQLLENSYEYNKDIPNRKKVVYGDTDSIFIKISDKNSLPNFESSINKILELFGSDVLFSSENRLKVELKYYGIIYLTEVKKRYCVYIPDTDELEIKGMEMIKADYPIFFKEKMKELFYLILKENINYDQVLKFIEDADKQAKELYINFDKRVGKPVTLQRDEYKSLSPAARGMSLYNSIFGRYFQFKSKGILFQIIPINSKLDKNIKERYYSNLKELMVQEEKLDPIKEEKNLKWICIPFEEDEILIKNNQMLKDFCTPDYSMVDRYWKDRLKEYGLL